MGEFNHKAREGRKEEEEILLTFVFFAPFAVKNQ
jgi:hypothetical protein